MLALIKKILFIGDHVCPWWFSFSLDNLFRKFVHDPEKLLGDYIEEGMTVMDIGCGPGYFTVPMAVMVGEKGTVIAVDIQQRMLDRMMDRAKKAGVTDRIVPREATRHSLGIDGKADFALAFWMVHEVPDKRAFFGKVREAMKHGACLLVVEPYGHVMRKTFEKTIDAARDAGFTVKKGPKISLSRSAELYV